MKRKKERSIASFFTKRVTRESGDNSTPSSLPTKKRQVRSNNIPSSSTSPSQNDEQKTETTSTSTPSSLPAKEIQVQSNNIPSSSTLPSQNGEQETETTSTPITQTSIGGRLTTIDVLNLPQDPGLRKKMCEYHPSDRDIIRREYCSRKLCQPENHDFPFTCFGKKNRRFNPKWFDKFKDWLEYSVHKDAAFCFACYLFKDDNVGQNAFVSDGFRTWSKPHVLDSHVGANMSAHRKAMKSLENFKNQSCSIAGLKTLIMNESPSAYHVHCFAHQLQLTLVDVGKKNDTCRWLFDDAFPLLINFVGGSPLRKEILREKQYNHVVHALSLGELETGSGLNQELSILRPGDTRWSSYFKCIKNVLSMFRPILESLEVIADARECDKYKALSIIGMLMSFDFVFIAHLMRSIFELTNSLNASLQKKEQDIINAMKLVETTKMDLQQLRDNGWKTHLDSVISFMSEYDSDIPNMDDLYVSHVGGRRMVRGMTPRVTNLHHFRVEVFLSVLDLQIQELEN